MGSLRVGHDWATSLSLFTFHFPALEKEMATHSSVLAWRIPGTGEPDGLPSMGAHRVGHDWNDLVAAVAVQVAYNNWFTTSFSHHLLYFCHSFYLSMLYLGWGGLMASSTQWTWVWANSRRWWRAGKPGMLQSMGQQRVRQNWATEQQQQQI